MADRKNKKNKNQSADCNDAKQLNNSSNLNDSNNLSKTEEVDYKDKYIRLLAEYSNFVKQKELEVEKLTFLANKDVLLRLMDLLDDLELYLKQELNDQSKELIELVKSRILQIFELQNVTKLDIKPGDDYNPDLCEVVHVIDNSEMKGKIIDVVRNGYKIKDIIIRVAKVVVAS